MSQKSIIILLYSFLGIIIAFTIMLLAFLAPQFRAKGPTPFPTFSPTIPSIYIDRSFITGIPCQAPCWYSIEVEKSTHDEVMNVVKALPFLNSDHIFVTQSSYYDGIQEINLPATIKNVECTSRRHRSCVTFVFVENILKTIMISPNFSLSFEEAVEALGNPDYVRAWPGDRGNIDACDIALQWEEELIQIIARNVGEDIPENCSVAFNKMGVHPYLDVDVIVYMSPDHPGVIGGPAYDGAYPWKGFYEE